MDLTPSSLNGIFRYTKDSLSLSYNQFLQQILSNHVINKKQKPIRLLS